MHLKTVSISNSFLSRLTYTRVTLLTSILCMIGNLIFEEVVDDNSNIPLLQVQ